MSSFSHVWNGSKIPVQFISSIIKAAYDVDVYSESVQGWISNTLKTKWNRKGRVEVGDLIQLSDPVFFTTFLMDAGEG